MATNHQLNIRVDLKLKEEFIAKAKENGTTATNLLVGFMQQYLGIEPRKHLITVNAANTDRHIDNRLSELEQRLEKRIDALETKLVGES